MNVYVLIRKLPCSILQCPLLLLEQAPSNMHGRSEHTMPSVSHSFALISGICANDYVLS